VLLSGPRQAGDCAVTRIWARWDNVLAAKGRLNSRYTDDAEMICNCVFQRTISPEHFLSAPTYLQGAQRSKNTIEAAAGQRNERRNKQVLKYGTEVETKPNRLARSHLIIWYPELHSKSVFFHTTIIRIQAVESWKLVTSTRKRYAISKYFIGTTIRLKSV